MEGFLCYRFGGLILNISKIPKKKPHQILERLFFGILRYTLHFLSFPSIHLSLLLTFHSNDIFVCHPHQTLSAQTEKATTVMTLCYIYTDKKLKN